MWLSLGEHLLREQGAAGSNPAISTRRKIRQKNKIRGVGKQALPSPRMPLWRNWQRICFVIRGLAVRDRPGALCRHSSAGGAPALQAGSRRFEPFCRYECPYGVIGNTTVCHAVFAGSSPAMGSHVSTCGVVGNIPVFQTGVAGSYPVMCS